MRKLAHCLRNQHNESRFHSHLQGEVEDAPKGKLIISKLYEDFTSNAVRSSEVFTANDYSWFLSCFETKLPRSESVLGKGWLV
jgi:hypothetical protein